MIYGIRGDWGWLFSLGFKGFCDELAQADYAVNASWTPQLIEPITYNIQNQPGDEPIILVGYSLGGNACAWVAQQLAVRAVANRTKPRKIKLVVAFDPTRQGVDLGNYPLGPHVERAICFYGVGNWPMSWFFGGGLLIGPQVEVIKTKTDHLFVQFDRELRGIAKDAIAKALA